MIVPIEVKELYTSSLENRKSLTIIKTVRADGHRTLPPFIITPRAKIIENWIAVELVGNKTLDYSLTGYINNEIIMEYAKHLIKYTNAGPSKPWKLLLLDGYESHRYEPF